MLLGRVRLEHSDDFIPVGADGLFALSSASYLSVSIYSRQDALWFPREEMGHQPQDGTCEHHVHIAGVTLFVNKRKHTDLVSPCEDVGFHHLGNSLGVELDLTAPETVV